MIFPVAGRGRPRQRYPQRQVGRRASNAADRRWRTISWRRGTKGQLSARFAAMRVRVADGPTPRIRDIGAQHLPGEKLWVIGEHRSTGERKYYLPPTFLPTPRSSNLLQPSRRAGSATSSPAVEGRARPRPLRRPIMGGPPPTRPYDDDRLRLPAIPPPQAGQRGEKNPRTTAPAKPARDPTGHPPGPRTAAARPMSVLSQILTNYKSAKVVLGPVDIHRSQITAPSASE